VSSGPQLWGLEMNAVRRINEGDGMHWDMLLGVRYLDLDENLAMTQNTTLLPNGVAGFGGQTIRSPNGLSTWTSSIPAITSSAGKSARGSAATITAFSSIPT
jgi:hypothetical protein